jgi:hypothetical protein
VDAFAHLFFHIGTKGEGPLTVYSTYQEATPSLRITVTFKERRAYPIIHYLGIARFLGGAPLRRHLCTHDAKYMELTPTGGHEVNKKQVY